MCVPENKDEGNSKNRNKKTRYERLQETASPLLILPPVPAGGSFFINLLADMGYCEPTGMGGVRGLSWSEIEAFDRMQNLDLAPIESKWVYRMSKEYAQQYNISLEVDCPAPYISEEFDDEIVEKAIEKQRTALDRMVEMTANRVPVKSKGEQSNVRRGKK